MQHGKPFFFGFSLGISFNHCIYAFTLFIHLYEDYGTRDWDGESVFRATAKKVLDGDWEK